MKGKCHIHRVVALMAWPFNDIRLSILLCDRNIGIAYSYQPLGTHDHGSSLIMTNLKIDDVLGKRRDLFMSSTSVRSSGGSQRLSGVENLFSGKQPSNCYFRLTW